MLQRKKQIIETHSRSTTDGRETCVTDPREVRRYPVGAELIGANQTHFRVWAPKATSVDVVLEESAAKNAHRTFHPLQREDDGYFSASANARTGDCYRFR